MAPSFKKNAQRIQECFREKLHLAFDRYTSMLSKKDAENGKNFFDGFDVFNSVKKRFKEKYKQQLYANMLRSEHIPFNIFIPLRENKDLFAKVINDAFGLSCQSVSRVEIEHAPEIARSELKDRTSFDAYCEYEDDKNRTCFLAIEVKYTEKSYRIGKKERSFIENPKSTYWDWTTKSELFVEDAHTRLRTDKLRQNWRNLLLAHIQWKVNDPKFHCYTSILLYPSGNEYLKEACVDFRKLLVPQKQDAFRPITYETLLEALKKHASGKDVREWIDYLGERYLGKREISKSE